MMNAYDEMYLEDAMQNLGEAFDYAVNGCGMDGDAFFDMFVASELAKQFGAGVPKYVSGISGTELVYEVVQRSGVRQEFAKVRIEYDFAPEYWAGWILAYYQWRTGRSFKNIRRYISVTDLLNRYSTLHEASEEKCVAVLDAMIASKNAVTQLQLLRKARGYSQKMLADKSGVTLRMIQQYEQRVKDINKASAWNLLALANVLGCGVEDLMEYSMEEI